MSADLVVGGLGGDGPIVTAGLGLAGAHDPNALRATLSGTSTLTAALTAGVASEPTAPVGGYFGGYAIPIAVAPPSRPGWMVAHLIGGSTLTAHLDFTIDFDDELEQLMLLGIV